MVGVSSALKRLLFYIILVDIETCLNYSRKQNSAFNFATIKDKLIVWLD